MYSVYQQRYAYFVANGINVWFVLIGGCLLYPQLYCSSKRRAGNTLNQPQCVNADGGAATSCATN
jgi:hypothetical protein